MKISKIIFFPLLHYLKKTLNLETNLWLNKKINLD